MDNYFGTNTILRWTTSQFRLFMLALASLLLAIVLLLTGCNGDGEAKSERSKFKEKIAVGDKYMSEGKYDKAVSAYKDALALDNTALEPFEGLSRAYTSLGKLDEAESILVEGINAWKTAHQSGENTISDGSGSSGTPSALDSPMITGNFPLTVTVNQGEQVNLPGTIVSSSNIIRVKIGIEGYYETWDYKFPNTPSFNMNAFAINTANGFFSNPGTYTILVWAKTIAIPNPSAELGRFSLVVKPPQQNLSNEATPPNPSPPILNPASGQYTITQGERFILPGTITCGSDLLRVYVGVSGLVDIYDSRDPIPGVNVFAMQQFVFDSSSGLFSTPGTYLLTIKAKSVGHPEPQSELGTITLIVNPVAKIPPTVMAMPATLTMTLGDKISLQGTISSPSDLSNISVSVDSSSIGNLINKNLSPGTKSFDLRDLTIDTASGSIFRSGTYPLSIWVKTIGFPDPTQPIGRINLVVSAPTPPTATGFSGVLYVKLGDSLSLPGYVNSTSNLESVSIGVLGKVEILDTKLINSKSYDLSNFTLSTTSGPLSTPGNYLITLKAKSAAFSNNSEIGRITLVVK